MAVVIDDLAQLKLIGRRAQIQIDSDPVARLDSVLCCIMFVCAGKREQATCKRLDRIG